MKELVFLKESLEKQGEEYNIQEIKIINASVKIIKMKWDEIPIDISFNQIGGITTYQYLEEVDKAIGRDHLFKKAILMIKAWCMYEGRILGSNIGCFSSYTIEVLIIHILINSEIKTPLEVFFKFFELNWSQFAISIFDAIRIEDVRNDPELFHNSLDYDEGENHDSIHSDLKRNQIKLSKKYKDSFKSLWEKYEVSAPSEYQAPLSYYFNIIDPINPSNNLGKWVSNFNSKRIPRILESQRKKLHNITYLKEVILNNSASPQEIVQYKLNLQGIFSKIYSIMDHSKYWDSSQWMQVKLINNQIQMNYPQMYGYQALPSQNYNMYYPSQVNWMDNYSFPDYFTPVPTPIGSETEQKYNSDFLKGEKISFLEGDYHTSIEKRQDKRKSPFTSTWKSTVNSHQENIPSMNVVVNEEIKHPDSIFKTTTKNKSLSLEPIRVKRVKTSSLVAPKTREPLSVRNTNGISSNVELWGISNPFLSTIN